MLIKITDLNDLSRYNPAADIPMSYGLVILGITLGFSGLGKITTMIMMLFDVLV